MTWTVAIDPGLRACGVSIFSGSTLRGAALVRGSSARKEEAIGDMAHAVDTYLSADPLEGGVAVLIEYPVQYSRSPTPRESVQSLVAVIGAITQSVRPRKGWEVSYVEPWRWKGQVPKPVMSRRVLGRLSEAEKGLIPDLPASLRHNVLDAVGIGLFGVNRLGGRGRKRGR